MIEIKSEYTFAEMDEKYLQNIADIMNYYVLNTTVTFHTIPLTKEEIRDKVFFKDPFYKSMLIKKENEIIGWCAVSPWKKQQAYRHTAEINIYLHHEHTSKGIGSIAIEKLEAMAKKVDINNLIAGVCAENIPSIKLFEKMGFTHCAKFLRTGKKFGRVLDMVYLQKILES